MERKHHNNSQIHFFFTIKKSLVANQQYKTISPIFSIGQVRRNEGVLLVLLFLNRFDVLVEASIEYSIEVFSNPSFVRLVSEKHLRG